MFLLRMLIVVFAISSSLLAQVRIFKQGNKSFQSQNINFSLPKEVISTSRINWGLINAKALEFVQQSPNVFPEISNRANEIRLQKRDKDYFGITLRYQQTYNRVSVEGAELILNFDKFGKLQSVNNSLVDIPLGFNIIPGFSKTKAYSIAVNQIGYRKPELGNAKNDGLLITIDKRTKTPLLLWQFSIRETYDKSKPYIVQIIAYGRSAGRIYRKRSAIHEFQPRINIYNGRNIKGEMNNQNLGPLVLSQGRQLGKNIPGEAFEAYNNFETVANFYFTQFSQASFNGMNAIINASVNITDEVLIQNAAWFGPWKTFFFGAGGDELGNFTQALDVVGHEYTHAVIDQSSGLIYEGQSGALNEHLADVFGEMIEVANQRTRGQFLIGERVVLKSNQPLRDMLHPERGLSAQPGHVSQIPQMFRPGCIPNEANDNCGVHILSGIPNKFAALSVSQIGWKKMQLIFYRVMTRRLSSKADFIDYKNHILDECENQLNQNDCSILESSFARVGIL